MLSSWSIQANRLFGLKAPKRCLAMDAGRKHADATFKRARAPYRLRQALFVADKLTFAFAPGTRRSATARAKLSERPRYAIWRSCGAAAARWRDAGSVADSTAPIRRQQLGRSLGAASCALTSQARGSGAVASRAAVPFRCFAEAARAEMAKCQTLAADIGEQLLVVG